MIFPNSSDIPQFSKLEFEIRCKSCFKNLRWGNVLPLFPAEEDINLLVEKAVPENTKKSTSYAVNVFDGKLLVNVSFNCQHN